MEPDVYSSIEDFPAIALTKEELTFLRHLTESDVSETYHTRMIASRLVKLRLVKSVSTTFSDRENTTFYQLTPRGENYLHYHASLSRAERHGRIRYWITTAIAIAALLKSFSSEICAISALVWKLLTR